MKIRVSPAIQMLKALTNPYNSVIFIFHASNSQIPGVGRWRCRWVWLFQVLVVALNRGESFLNHGTGELGRRHVCSCPGAGRGSLGQPLGGDVMLQPTNSRTWLWGWITSLFPFVSVSHYSSLFQITKNHTHSSQVECVLLLMVTGKRSTSLYLDALPFPSYFVPHSVEEGHWHSNRLRSQSQPSSAHHRLVWYSEYFHLHSGTVSVPWVKNTLSRPPQIAA